MPVIKKTVRRPWMKERKAFSGERVAPNRSFYHSSAWRALRNRFIADHPLCAECLEKGVITPATVVDHIKPINEGGEPLDENNLQSLCARCHNKKSAREAHKNY